MLQSLIAANNPDYVPKPFHFTLVIFALLIFFGLENGFTWYESRHEVGHGWFVDEWLVLDPLAGACSRNPACRLAHRLGGGFRHSVSTEERRVRFLEVCIGDWLGQPFRELQPGPHDAHVGCRGL